MSESINQLSSENHNIQYLEHNKLRRLFTCNFRMSAPTMQFVVIGIPKEKHSIYQKRFME